MYLERTHYYAKPGRAADVLRVRRRACRIRLELGLPAGSIFVKRGDEGPDVQWECTFDSAEAHRCDLEARAASDAFRAVREEMTALLERFERHVLETEGRGHVSLADVSLRPVEHRFPSLDGELHGFLYLPPGPPEEGPYPCVVLNHGSTVTHESTDIVKPSVASVLVSFGYACFFPHRWGYGRSTGLYWRDVVLAEFGTEAYDRQLVRRLHRESHDVIAALDYVETLPSIDGSRVAVMGSSFGGTVSLLAAAKCDRFRCAVDFAGAAMNWESTPRLRELMKQAARALSMPIFLAQAANDYSTRPTTELADVLEVEGKRYWAKVFPSFGVTQDEGHLFERGGSVVWGRDLRTFLERYL
jgi:carboxymethylenebutenolidase